jgi:hypothetical protein
MGRIMPIEDYDVHYDCKLRLEQVEQQLHEAEHNTRSALQTANDALSMLRLYAAKLADRGEEIARLKRQLAKVTLPEV